MILAISRRLWIPVLVCLCCLSISACDQNNRRTDKALHVDRQYTDSNEIVLYLGASPDSTSVKVWSTLDGKSVSLEDKPIHHIRSLGALRLLIVKGDSDAEELCKRGVLCEPYTPMSWDPKTSQLTFEFTAEDSNAISSITEDNLKRRLAFTQEHKILIAPIIVSPLFPPTGKKTLAMQIDLGNFELPAKLSLLSAMKGLIR